MPVGFGRVKSLGGIYVWSRKKWTVSQYDKDMAAELAESYELDPFAALLLVSRGVTADNADEFLYPQCDIDPFLLPDMEKAANRIRKAIESFEKIAVFGDYDADGVTSAAVMYSYLESRGADVICHIPDRINEGYGISPQAVENLKERGVSLIITVDNGISAFDAAKTAKELSVDLVITDHHKQSGELPEAVAVVDPQRTDCNIPFRDWAGVGVAFKTICAVEGDGEEELLDEFSDLVAIGTLADVVPLKKENRALVYEGLKRINSGSRQGIEALKNAAGVSGKKLGAGGISFTLAPRINAAGRMGSAMTAFRLLLSDDENDAAELAKTIDTYNKERHSVENEITKQAIAEIESRPDEKYASVIVVSGENWHQGVIGIVAARLGVEKSRIDEFRTAINEYAKTVEMPFPELRLDCKLNPAYINMDLINSLELLEPFGAGNEEPCFGLFNMKISRITPIGDGKHLRLALKKGNTEITALLFSVRAEEFPFRLGDTVDAAVKITKNEFRGEVKPSVRICDMRFSGSNDVNYLKSVRLYEKYRRHEKLNEKELRFITPNRDFLASAYKFFKKSGGWNFDLHSLLIRANCPEASAATLLVSEDVLCELKLMEKTENGAFSLCETSEKKDLDSSKILAGLKAEMGENHG